MAQSPVNKRRKPTAGAVIPASAPAYGQLVSGISALLEQARRGAARSVNAILTATYWEIGRRIVEHEQGGKGRAEYGKELLVRLGDDLTRRYGRGFSWRNLYQMRLFFQGWEIWQTPSAQFEARAICPMLSDKSHGAKFPASAQHGQILQTVSAKLSPLDLPGLFPLSWSHYVRLMSVEKPHARAFYESEAIRGGWSVRQLDRQISTQFFERTAHSKNPAGMLARAQQPRPQDAVSMEDEVRNPYLREHMMEAGENEPVGIVLCSDKDDAVVHYAMGGIKAKVFASQYLTALPEPETLRQEIVATQQALEARAVMKGQHPG